ncbi:type II asparaginase [Chitinophagaceae bacterium LB-8]|uniref:Type II asparaginase n=1 Tax=Paraflavisolibacter caeni TaxID=2982496 RepID=A0A9X2XNX9_9BACT|nr:type II asparaginase [Paraflavisolibacter caeni]MCU7549389.1 type II asparaginase [Paraflavisolibacter caeni]
MKKFSISLSTFCTSVLLFTNIMAQTQYRELPDATRVAPPIEKTVAPGDKYLPNIVILATGGTIAGSAASSTQAGYTSGQVTIDAMIAAVPDAKKLANIKGEQISNVGSQDMSFDIMLKLANRINELTKSNAADGIVITHGTDTMEETAYFLNLVVKTDKPVVLVGSMRPSTALSADGPLNLYDAIAVAADPEAKGHGVMLVMNDQIHSAQSLVKVSTTAVQTFMSPLRGIIGSSAYGHNEFYRIPHKIYGANSEFSVEGVKTLPRVDIVYACVDMPADLIDASVQRGAKGIVIAGVGNGNMTKAALDACQRAVQKGVVVVRSSRVATGDIGRNVEVDDNKIGTIASYELNPQKSRILLSVALLKQRKPEEIQKLFMEY